MGLVRNALIFFRERNPLICKKKTRDLALFTFWGHRNIGTVLKAKCGLRVNKKHFAARLPLLRALQGVRKREKHRVRGPQSN